MSDQPPASTTASGPGTQPGPQAARPLPLPPLAAIAAHVEALNLAGIAFSAKRLIGKDPAQVMGQFAMWARAHPDGLPSLTQPFWAALAPLQLGRPASPAAGLCEEVLRGRHNDGQLASSAANDCAAAGKTMFKANPLPALDGSDPTLPRLLDVVKDYWRSVGGVYQDVRPLVIAGDVTAALGLLEHRREAMSAMVQRTATLAAALAEASPTSVEPTGPPLDDEPPPAVQPAPEPQPAPTVEPVQESAVAPTGSDPGTLALNPEGLQLTDEQAEAFATHRRIAEPEPQPARPVEVLSRKPVRNHPFLPIVFVLIVSGVALYVLYAVINNPANPLR